MSSRVERLPTERVRLCITIPARQYEFLVKWARLSGSTAKRLAADLIRICSGLPWDIYDDVRYKTVSVGLETEAFLDIAYKRGEIKVKPDPGEVRKTLGELTTVLSEVYCDVPSSLDITKLSSEELAKLSEAIRDVTGKVEDPITYLRRTFERMEPWAKAFYIRIEKERDTIKGVKFLLKDLLARYSYPLEIVERMPPKPLTCLRRS